MNDPAKMIITQRDLDIVRESFARKARNTKIASIATLCLTSIFAAYVAIRIFENDNMERAAIHKTDRRQQTSPDPLIPK